MKKLTWEEFQRSGMMWFVNRILSSFGYAIVVDGDGAYPACLHELGLESDEADTAREVFLQNIKPWKRPRITDLAQLNSEDRRFIESIEKLG
jgi:hypothetical protein